MSKRSILRIVSVAALLPLLACGGKKDDGSVSCSDVCKHTAAVCQVTPPASCADQCERELSAAERSCIAAAATCTAIVACHSAGPQLDGGAPSDDGGRMSGDDAGTTRPSSPQELAAAWDEFSSSAVAASDSAGILIEFWGLDIVVNGAVAYHELTITTRAQARQAILKQSFGAGDKLAATFIVQVRDKISGKLYIWRQKEIKTGL